MFWSRRRLTPVIALMGGVWRRRRFETWPKIGPPSIITYSRPAPAWSLIDPLCCVGLYVIDEKKREREKVSGERSDEDAAPLIAPSTWPRTAGSPVDG